MTDLDVDAENRFLFHHVPEGDVRLEAVEHAHEVAHQLEVPNLLHWHVVQHVVAAILGGLAQVEDAEARARVCDTQHAVLLRALGHDKNSDQSCVIRNKVLPWSR